MRASSRTCGWAPSTCRRSGGRRRPSHELPFPSPALRYALGTLPPLRAVRGKSAGCGAFAPSLKESPFPRGHSPLMARLVMKFGGTSVADLDRIRNVARHVKREGDAGNDVAVVGSAMAGATHH